MKFAKTATPLTRGCLNNSKKLLKEKPISKTRLRKGKILTKKKRKHANVENSLKEIKIKNEFSSQKQEKSIDTKNKKFESGERKRMKNESNLDDLNNPVSLLKKKSRTRKLKSENVTPYIKEERKKVNLVKLNIKKNISKIKGRKVDTEKYLEQNNSTLRYPCSICKKQYKYRRNKLRHEKYECTSGPQFACQLCDKRYSQKKTLNFHIASKHPQETKNAT